MNNAELNREAIGRRIMDAIVEGSLARVDYCSEHQAPKECKASHVISWRENSAEQIGCLVAGETLWAKIEHELGLERERAEHFKRMVEEMRVECEKAVKHRDSFAWLRTSEDPKATAMVSIRCDVVRRFIAAAHPGADGRG